VTLRTSVVSQVFDRGAAGATVSVTSQSDASGAPVDSVLEDVRSELSLEPEARQQTVGKGRVRHRRR
jgi:hypothetical protein